MSLEPGSRDSLFSDIDGYLRVALEAARGSASRSFWCERPWITRNEISLLAALSFEARCIEFIAANLGRERSEAQALVDAFVGVGLMELYGERYMATPAAALYCRGQVSES